MTTPQTFNDSSNPTVQRRVLLAEDTQAIGTSAVLTDEELELSKNVVAEFYTASVQVPNDYVVTSEADGSERRESLYDHTDPVYKDFDMVRTTTPNPASGQPTVTDHFVTHFHITRWPDRWRAYKSGKAQHLDGTPLDNLNSIPVAARLKLKEQGVFTIEQLAKLGDPAGLIMGGNTFQAAARKFLAGTQINKQEQLEEELAALKSQLNELLKAKKDVK